MKVAGPLAAAMAIVCTNCGSELAEDEVRCEACFLLHDGRLQEAIDRYYDTSTTVSQSGEGTYRRRETFQEKVRLVFPRVEKVAREERTSTQKEIWGDGVDPWAMKHYLGAVSSIEHWDERPLLSSVIVNYDRGFPADGYFALVDRLGIEDGIAEWNPEEQEMWWENELADVHRVWSGLGY